MLTGDHTLLEFKGAPIGHYMKSISQQQKLMYIVDLVGSTDKSNRQAFFHPVKKDDEGGGGGEGPPLLNVATLRGLPPGLIHTVCVSTVYNGRDIVEAQFEVKSRPRPPSEVTASKWSFAIRDGDIAFTLQLEWDHSPATNQTSRFVVEIAAAGEDVTSTKTNAPKSSHTFKLGNGGLDRLVAKIWSIDSTDEEELKSKTSLQFDVPPLPQSMVDYANVIKSKVSRSGADSRKLLTSYAFNLEVLNLIKSEMMTVLKDIQEATSITDEVDTLLENQESTEPVIDIE